MVAVSAPTPFGLPHEKDDAPATAPEAVQIEGQPTLLWSLGSALGHACATECGSEALHTALIGLFPAAVAFSNLLDSGRCATFLLNRENSLAGFCITASSMACGQASCDRSSKLIDVHSARACRSEDEHHPRTVICVPLLYALEWSQCHKLASAASSGGLQALWEVYEECSRCLPCVGSLTLSVLGVENSEQLDRCAINMMMLAASAAPHVLHGSASLIEDMAVMVGALRVQQPYTYHPGHGVVLCSPAQDSSSAALGGDTVPDHHMGHGVAWDFEDFDWVADDEDSSGGSPDSGSASSAGLSATCRTGWRARLHDPDDDVEGAPQLAIPREPRASSGGCVAKLNAVASKGVCEAVMGNGNAQPGGGQLRQQHWGYACADMIAELDGGGRSSSCADRCEFAAAMGVAMANGGKGEGGARPEGEQRKQLCAAVAAGGMECHWLLQQFTSPLVEAAYWVMDRQSWKTPRVDCMKMCVQVMTMLCLLVYAILVVCRLGFTNSFNVADKLPWLLTLYVPYTLPILLCALFWSRGMYLDEGMSILFLFSCRVVHLPMAIRLGLECIIRDGSAHSLLALALMAFVSPMLTVSIIRIRFCRWVLLLPMCCATTIALVPRASELLPIDHALPRPLCAGLLYALVLLTSVVVPARMLYTRERASRDAFKEGLLRALDQGGSLSPSSNVGSGAAAASWPRAA